MPNDPNDKTPGFSMSKCIAKLKGQASNPAAVCQSIFQKVKAGKMKNPFPENVSERLTVLKESFKERVFEVSDIDAKKPTFKKVVRNVAMNFGVEPGVIDLGNGTVRLNVPLGAVQDVKDGLNNANISFKKIQ